METFKETYSEIATNEMKYEHLFVVCNNLLKNWPHRDDAGRLVCSEKRSSQEREVVQGSTPVSRPLTTELKAVDKAFEEMQLLDAILQKAKKVRTSPKQKMKRAAHAHQTETVRGGSLTSKCSEQAARVYKQPVSRAVRLAVRKSSSTSSSQRRRKKTAMTVTAEHFTGSDRCHKTAMPPAEGEDGAHRKDGANFNHDDYESGKNLSLEMAAFNVQQQGTKLTMPSRYYRVQQALSKLSEEATQQPSSTAGEQFCKHLSGHSDCGSLQTLHKLLVVEELSWLQQKLQSLTPQELTVNDRSSWEEVWRIKAKFEALTEHAKKVGDIHFCKGSATTSTKEIGRESLSCAPLKVSTRETGGESLGPAPPKVFVYSSVSEWESLVTVEMELLLSKHKLELAQFVNQKLLPLLPVANCPTQVMQTIFELVEISKPIYVKLSDSETNY